MESKEVKIVFDRSDGQQFVIDCDKYIIPNDGIEGVDFPTWNVYSTEKAYGDGSVITAKAYSSRTINIKFETGDPSDLETKRDEIRKFFNAKFDYTITITYQGVQRWIKGALNGFSLPSKNVFANLETKVGFLCEDPLFRSMSWFGKDLSSETPRFGFPFIATEQYKPVISSYEFPDTVEILNDGDEETRFRAYLYFYGEVVNPRIMTGIDKSKKFELQGTFNTNDEIIVDFASHFVKRNGVPCYNLVSYDSESLSLPVGLNYVSVEAHSGGELLHCYLYFYKRYSGI